MRAWLSAGLVLGWLAVAGAQTPAMQAHVLTLFSGTVSAVMAAPATVAVPSTGNALRISCIRNATVVTATAVLKAAVQISADDGTTWNDLMIFNNATTAPDVQIANFVAPNSATFASPSGQGDFGTPGNIFAQAAWSQMRLKYQVTVAAPVTFSVKCTVVAP